MEAGICRRMFFAVDDVDANARGLNEVFEAI